MEIYDCIIIGSGPAGYTAGIYTSRGGLNTLILEGKLPGGQLMNTTVIENFPGHPSIDAADLMDIMRNQAIQNGCNTKDIEATEVKKHNNNFIITCSNVQFKTKTIIIATGAYPKKLEFKNSEKFWKHGIGSCAVCDGSLPQFRNQPIVIIGGGDTAMEDALFLSRFASRIIILVRSEKLKASKILVKKVIANPKIKIRYGDEVIEANGSENKNLWLEHIIIKNNKTSKKKKIYCSGLFYAIGHEPNTKFIKNLIDMNNSNYILKTENNSNKTNIPGIFSAGDVSDPIFRQAITAAGSGCMAAIECIKFLEN